MAIFQKGSSLFDSDKAEFLTTADDKSKIELAVETLMETEVVSVQKDVELIEGIDRTVIHLQLKTNDGPVAPQSGFLVEVFYSGSNGVLQRAYRDDTVDVIKDDVIEEGFEKYIRIDVDVEQ